MNSRTVVQSLSPSQLLSATRELVQKSRGTEADVLEHLGEIEERKLYLDGPFPSMFAFCVGEYGFSEDVACQRMAVARAARRLPGILDSLRSGRVHMTGLRLLAPHLNHIPDAIKRVVFERDAGRCTFTDELGRRCPEAGALEFDHVDGFARTHVHRAEDIRLLCRAHNQHAAEQMYGRAFMERARGQAAAVATVPGVPSG